MFPIKVLYDFVELKDATNLQCGVTVSSRNFKKAVHRNRVKRVVREAYRLHKPALHNMLQQRNLQMAVFIIYVNKALPNFNEVNDKMEVALNKLSELVIKKQQA